MSSYQVVRQVSEALRLVLSTAFKGDKTIQQFVGGEPQIVFKNPEETAKDSANCLSLWLYQITENEFVKNQSMQRGKSADVTQYPPMALNLYYLVTPFAHSGESDHLLLGKTMQVMYDNSIVLLRDSLMDIAEELRIIFCRLSLEELTRIWEALREPYRLSVCYQVRVTRIDSARTSTKARVVEMTSGFADNTTAPAEQTL